MYPHSFLSFSNQLFYYFTYWLSNRYFCIS